jgi:hypothetical protein
MGGWTSCLQYSKNMLNWINSLLPKRKPKFYLLNDKYRVTEAFRVGGVSYMMFDDAFQIPSGRGMTALTFYEELAMRADRAYLEKHVRAVDLILSNPKKIDIGTLALIHNNLKERLSLVPLPEHIYRLASVIFFDKTESPYSYDHAYGKAKIARWKREGATLDFFMRTPLASLIPFSGMHENNLNIFLQTTEQIAEMHQTTLSEVLSGHQ